MAAGLPVIANPVGVHVEMIRHGETGYLATTSHEWVEAMRKLASDPARRQRMGAAGRQRIERDYSVSAAGAAWTRMLQAFSREPRASVDAALAGGSRLNVAN
jgi:glycosyltransferase involved in cell wall biosynthesis